MKKILIAVFLIGALYLASSHFGLMNKLSVNESEDWKKIPAGQLPDVPEECGDQEKKLINVSTTSQHTGRLALIRSGLEKCLREKGMSEAVARALSWKVYGKRAD